MAQLEKAIRPAEQTGQLPGDRQRPYPVKPREYGAFGGLYWWYVYSELELGPVLTAI